MFPLRNSEKIRIIIQKWKCQIRQQLGISPFAQFSIHNSINF